MAEVEKELKCIRKELVTIRRYLENGLDSEDALAIKLYRAEKARGELHSHAKLKKEL